MGEPYTRAPGSTLRLVPGQDAGGRPITGPDLAALRADDFQRKSIDGLGDNWPITYDDIKPYYDRVDDWSAFSGAKKGFATIRTATFCRRPNPAVMNCW
jgi:choline dehydrogenase-like flavoprotein